MGRWRDGVEFWSRILGSLDSFPCVDSLLSTEYDHFNFVRMYVAFSQIFLLKFFFFLQWLCILIILSYWVDHHHLEQRSLSL